jgi:tetratricopeptide (TPR) repeat protein
LASVDALHRWVDAVDTHIPGRADAAVGGVIGMTYAARVELNTSFPLFIRVLREDLVVTHSELEKSVTAFARTVRSDPGIETFLKRAAILHADAVVFAGQFPEPPDDAPAIAPAQRGAGDWAPFQRVESSPLLTNEPITLSQDGEVLGDAKVNWNLPFARSLLDLLLNKEPKAEPERPCANERDPRCRIVELGSHRVSRDDSEFVADWYHAVAAYLFSRGMNGDAIGHLRQAARVFPDDPRLLFDRATYAEWFGLPIYQAIGSDRIPAEAMTNAEAERLYRRTIELDASNVEARVRLARLLDRRGRHDEAAAEIATALEAKPGGIVAFYGQIVAGRIATARGRYDEALRFYREASTLYRHAQSALLGASHAAVMLANEPEAMAPLAELPRDGAFRDFDPWLDYGIGAGRDVTSQLAALWARVAK